MTFEDLAEETRRKISEAIQGEEAHSKLLDGRCTKRKLELMAIDAAIKKLKSNEETANANITRPALTVAQLDLKAKVDAANAAVTAATNVMLQAPMNSLAIKERNKVVKAARKAVAEFAASL